MIQKLKRKLDKYLPTVITIAKIILLTIKVIRIIYSVISNVKWIYERMTDFLF
jgi:hypothetical protein